MKITKCDRCGKIFDPSRYVMISDDGKCITYPSKLTFESICNDCQKSIRDGLDEFKNGGGSMDA